MNQQDLIKLAKDLGFDAKFVSSTTWKYSNRENIRHLIWLTELRYYIFEKWKVYIAVAFLPAYNLFEYNLKYVIDQEVTEDESKLSYKSEIEALYAGVSYFLTKIEDNDK